MTGDFRILRYARLVQLHRDSTVHPRQEISDKLNAGISEHGDKAIGVPRVHLGRGAFVGGDVFCLPDANIDHEIHHVLMQPACS